MTRTGWAGWLVLLLCFGHCAQPDRVVTPPVVVRPRKSEPVVPEDPRRKDFVVTEVVDPGFTHCCGTAAMKMEVDCGERLKRCYIRHEGKWKQTYGRHCKSGLGPQCYLHTCDDVCD